MQDSSSYIYPQIKPQFPEQEILKCPRCDSINTKFCYYNNYNLSQPRHFCKNCKRYWTKGGILRNIPVGGTSRKNTKRPSSSSSSSTTSKRSSPSTSSAQNSTTKATPVSAFDQNGPILDANGPFGSLFGSKGPEMGNLLQVLNPNGPNSGSDAATQNGNNSRNEYLGEDSNCRNIGTNGWANLAIYTPGSRFQ